MYRAVFRRYELKYLLTRQEKDALLSRILPYIVPDEYGKTTVRNLYFDTENYQLIRRSIEKPPFKEKLRLRSYRRADDADTVFAELKRKYDGVVYKRRLGVPFSAGLSWLCKMGKVPVEGSQIEREISYFLSCYDTLSPTVFLSYEREAYYDRDNRDFRITFDDNVLARKEDLSLSCEPYGTSLLEEGYVLMELKCALGLPLWMTKALGELHLYKTSFSKYGTAYARLLYKGGQKNNFEG